MTSLPRSRPITPTIYSNPDSLPTLLINDHHTTLYNAEAQENFEPKQILIQIVKAVQLHSEFFWSFDIEKDFLSF